MRAGNEICPESEEENTITINSSSALHSYIGK